MQLAQLQEPKWKKMLQHERDQKVRIEKMVEQLARQHSHLEEAAQHAIPSVAPAGGHRQSRKFICILFSNIGSTATRVPMQASRVRVYAERKMNWNICPLSTVALSFYLFVYRPRHTMLIMPVNPITVTPPSSNGNLCRLIERFVGEGML